MAVEEFGDEIYFVLEHSFLEPHEFCGLFVKDCGQAENPFNQPWPLNIPGNKPDPKPWPIPDVSFLINKKIDHYTLPTKDSLIFGDDVGRNVLKKE